MGDTFYQPYALIHRAVEHHNISQLWLGKTRQAEILPMVLFICYTERSNPCEYIEQRNICPTFRESSPYANLFIHKRSPQSKVGSILPDGTTHGLPTAIRINTQTKTSRIVPFRIRILFFYLIFIYIFMYVKITRFIAHTLFSYEIGYI